MKSSAVKYIRMLSTGGRAFVELQDILKWAERFKNSVTSKRAGIKITLVEE